jgi:hypothetical protein
MPKIQVLIDQETGELQIMTDGINGDLSFGEGVSLTDVIRGEVDAATGGGLVLKSEVEQHKPGGVRHAHVVGVNTQRHGR